MNPARIIQCVFLVLSILAFANEADTISTEGDDPLGPSGMFSSENPRALVPTNEASSSCEVGWVQSGQTCIRFYLNDPRTFEDARATCLHENAAFVSGSSNVVQAVLPPVWDALWNEKISTLQCNTVTSESSTRISSCFSDVAFACQRDLSGRAPGTASPINWVSVGEQSFAILNDDAESLTSWKEAQKTCADAGGSIAEGPRMRQKLHLQTMMGMGSFG